jgi:hypothetical protein
MLTFLVLNEAGATVAGPFLTQHQAADAASAATHSTMELHTVSQVVDLRVEAAVTT